MNLPAPKSLLVLTLAALLVLGSAVPAHAAPTGGASVPTLAKISWPDWGNVVPKVKFKAKAKLKKNKVSVSLVATVSVAGKTLKIPVFNMGVKKSKKAIKVKRKVGKLSVSLKVSWAGTRTITIKGTAKYMKIKIPMPPIKVSI